MKHRINRFRIFLSKAKSLVRHIATNGLLIADFAPMNYDKYEVFKPQGIQEIHDEVKAEARIAATAHIFYEDFLDDFLSFLSETPPGFTWFITTPNHIIFDRIRNETDYLGIEVNLALTPNRGRNFGPLLVEFAKELQYFDYIFHLHSKKSTHARASISNLWDQAMTKQMLDWSNIIRSIGIFLHGDQIGLIYPDVSRFIRKINFRWGANLKALREAPPLLELVSGQEESMFIHFPPGGMFLVRTSPLIQFLSIKWNYEMFPEEKMQLDGTLQHAIERLIGFLIQKAGLQQVVFSNNRWFVLREDDIE